MAVVVDEKGRMRKPDECGEWMGEGNCAGRGKKRPKYENSRTEKLRYHQNYAPGLNQREMGRAKSENQENIDSCY